MLGRLACGLGSKEWGSLDFLFGVLLFCYKTQLRLLVAAGLVYRRWDEEREGGGGVLREPSASGSLLAATQDGGPALALPGWPPGCFLVASRARSQVITLRAAWGESECSGDSSTVAMNGRVDFPKKKLAHQ